MERSHHAKQWKACYCATQELGKSAKNDDRTQQSFPVVAAFERSENDSTQTERNGVRHTLKDTIRLVQCRVDLLDLESWISLEGSLALVTIDVAERLPLPVHCYSRAKQHAQDEPRIQSTLLCSQLVLLCDFTRRTFCSSNGRFYFLIK